MDSINTILGNKDFKEPEEIEKLKAYILSAYGSVAGVSLSPKGLVITVDSSALANTLSLNLPDIKRKLNIDQAIRIRVR